MTIEPTDEAIKAAKVEHDRWVEHDKLTKNQPAEFIVFWNNGKSYKTIKQFYKRKERDEALKHLRAEAMVTAAFAAQFKPVEEYAGLVERLRRGTVRYAAETHDEATIRRNKDRDEAADAIEAQQRLIIKLRDNYMQMGFEKDKKIKELESRLAPAQDAGNNL